MPPRDGGEGVFALVVLTIWHFNLIHLDPDSLLQKHMVNRSMEKRTRKFNLF